MLEDPDGLSLQNLFAEETMNGEELRQILTSVLEASETRVQRMLREERSGHAEVVRTLSRGSFARDSPRERRSGKDEDVAGAIIKTQKARFPTLVSPTNVPSSPFTPTHGVQ